jgi:RNA polymerase sigma factor (sigma-70 family)
MVLWSSHADRLGDEALLGAMALGDQRAGSVFVRRHQRAVFGLAVVMCRDSGLAEDLAQQTFERAWKHAGSFDARRGTAKVWLLTIARRLCIDTFRTQHSTPFDRDALEPLLTDHDDPVADVAAARADVLGVKAVIATLPSEQQRVLMLASLGGHTLVEIAEIEGIPLGTAKTRLRTALLRVRGQLTEREVSDE